jgi:hypothetical protein
MRCASGGHPWSSEPSWSRTGTTDGARRRCTTMGWTVTSIRPRSWYDILFLSFHKFFILLFNTLDSMLQKKITRVDTHYLDVWQPAHKSDVVVAEKLLSNNF